MKNSLNEYLGTVDRLEPEITSIDDSLFYASAAISLKRLADLREYDCLCLMAERHALTDEQEYRRFELARLLWPM